MKNPEENSPNPKTKPNTKTKNWKEKEMLKRKLKLPHG